MDMRWMDSTLACGLLRSVPEREAVLAGVEVVLGAEEEVEVLGAEEEEGEVEEEVSAGRTGSRGGGGRKERCVLGTRCNVVGEVNAGEE